MDRLNQLRGDAVASRDSTLDTSSVLGDAYMTASDSSKYFSLSDADSSSTVSPSKEAVDDVIGNSCVSDAGHIISNLSPISKKTELESFEIGEQIEAANILSGGVNIFDDNENSYDGDELVIDDAVAEGDDKNPEVKLRENAEVRFDKTDRLVDSGEEDAETAIPTRDTEVVLQIDGKNVDAIDIGNGLYLYRKDGEEELAAVQILDDNQQQPDIKFLKVRENAEGNLEVYEEIEIEVPKVVPTKEGKIVKNTSHIPVKDVNKVIESNFNKDPENKSLSISKDNLANEMDLDLDKDNVSMESRTEVNLNGKMMKFSESRKSPLIGTFTPMTYHSTPNKEGIPLTKTMVDLQLHPNRHSENVKKTIEVHTDNCKQRLLETPTKSTKDSNEHNRSSELMSSLLDKDISNSVIADGEDPVTQGNNKDINQATAEKKNDNKDELINNDKLENQQIKLSDKNLEGVVKDNKTERNDIKMHNIPKTSVTFSTPCKVSTNTFSKEDNEKELTANLPLSEGCSKIDNEIFVTQTHHEMSNYLQTGFAKEVNNECVRHEDVEVNHIITTGTDPVIRKQEIENENVNKNKNNIQNKEIHTENLIAGSQNISEVILSNTKNHTEKHSKAIQRISNNSTEGINYVKLPQNDLETKEYSSLSSEEQLKNNPLETLEISRKLDLHQEIKKINKPLETLGSSTKYVKLTNMKMKDSDNQLIQTLKSPSKDENVEIHIESKFTTPLKETETLGKTKPAVIKTGSMFFQPKPSLKIFHNLPQEELQTVSELKRDYKVNVSEAEQIKTDCEIRKLQLENRRLNSDNNLGKNPKFDDVTTEKKKDFENKKKSDKSSKEVKTVDVKLNEPETISSKIVKDVSKPAPNTICKSLHKDASNTEPNLSRNSSLLISARPVHKIETHSKNDLNQKLSMLSQNTKGSLLNSDLKLPNASQNISNEGDRSKSDTRKELTRVSKVSVPKPINNSKAAVPFGKWTEANRQEFLNKIKESKVPINTSNTKQLKQPNDLNRRDILQKIDSQRQSNIASTKVLDLNTLNKIKLKHETTAFVTKSNVSQKEKLKDTKVLPSKVEESVSIIPIDTTVLPSKKDIKEHPVPIPVDMSSAALSNKKDSVQRKEINNQDLIDKTIEGIINRAVTTKLGSEDVKQDIEPVEISQNATSFVKVSLDDIESKMNELHGIPFVERPPHELPKLFEHENKSIVTTDVITPSKSSTLPTALPCSKSQQKNEHNVNESVVTKVNDESDEDIIEHEPVTGDIQLNKNISLIHGPGKEKTNRQESIITKLNLESKKEQIITENEFDKFARRNSITYENCLTVNFDGKEHHNVVQTVIEKETIPKKLSRNEIMLAESKAKSHKQLAVRNSNFSSKIPTTTKATQDEDSYNKNYQSKVQIAYQSVMTAKRQQECPITIIEDKPVKVVFMDGNHEYIPHQLNVQGKELSPPKKSINEWDHFTHSNSESLDSDILDTSNDTKSQDDIKFKSKHQRKQVLTPVETPELELIEPGDLGIEVSPKKKRKMEDNKLEKNAKSLVPKKSYLLNRNIETDDLQLNIKDLTKAPLKESEKQSDVFVKHSDPISAIDKLVKAAELLETQLESKHTLPLTDQSLIAQQNSPVKRGRGRPRKYPQPESGLDDRSSSPVKTLAPQKKPRLIDAKIPKQDTESEDDEINSDGELVKENWTMGKINENIVCPICNKLFRSENVVFKHVKHCTGPSPSRSDSDKRSPRRMRQSQELDWKSEGSKSDSMDVDEDYEVNQPTKKRKSKEKKSSFDDKPDDKTEVIIIDDTPIKDRDSPIRKRERLKHEPNKTLVKEKTQYSSSGLVCEFCGKTFRQLSYLVNHRLQHKSIESKKSEKDLVHKSLFSCEICQKEFRKLHHLVQHRIIHKPNPMRSLRKSSSEQNDIKTTKDIVKANEDQSAGFRCEPCDKSFRKLHHLVEHRETHDEINKKCNPITSTSVETSKPTPLHHCDICKKTFKKLQHLIEHKEHHLDTSSEKSDDKSVQSSLSTKDIIHECPLCYMVFPNEHSLNKHHIICQRKKKQSAAKQAKQIDETDIGDVDEETKITEVGRENLANIEQKINVDTTCAVTEEEMPIFSEKQDSNIIEMAKPLEQEKETKPDKEIKSPEAHVPVKHEMDRKVQIHANLPHKKDVCERNAEKVSGKSKKQLVPTTTHMEIIKIPDTPTPKKKLLGKDKIPATVTKRQKTNSVALPVIDKVKTPDSSDDDEIRYMLNPNFQTEESNEGKMFMKVRAKKRNSLQIERPNSKDLMKRRISLQHPPKIPRLKVKPIPRKPINTNTIVKSSKTFVVPVPPASTDSDDSDVKYSFPEPVMKEMAKEAQKKGKRQKIVEKRKSLSNIAKRKSLGKIINVKQKINPSPAKQVKKRTADAEHRCDCGQLFSSAALLTRHTSLAHTPPRIRRRRSPPPENGAKPPLKRTEKSQEARKTIDPAPIKTGVTTRKSSIHNEVLSLSTFETRRAPKTATLTKTLRSTPHKGVPVPEKMRKFMEKSKK